MNEDRGTAGAAREEREWLGVVHHPGQALAAEGTPCVYI